MGYLEDKLIGLEHLERLIELMERHECIRVRVGEVEVVRDPRAPSQSAPSTTFEETAAAEVAMSPKEYRTPYEDPDLWGDAGPPVIPSETDESDE